MTKPDAAHVPALPLGAQPLDSRLARFTFQVPLPTKPGEIGALENVNVGTRADGAIELRFRLQAPLVDIAIQLTDEQARTLGKALTAPSVVVANSQPT